MKKKIVLKVSMNCDKSRSKALKIAVCISGVESAALSGEDKDQVVVVGEDIDAVALTRQLRKNLGFTELVSLGEDKKDPSPPPPPPAAKVEAPTPQPMVVWSYPPHYNGYPVHEMMAPPQESCTIM
ncbi:hypothetical protein ACS0TY_018777 [Phlomoides rotata]